MGFLDDYFEPQQFEGGGGLLGRLQALQREQAAYQPAWPQTGAAGSPQPVGTTAIPRTAVAPPPQNAGATALDPMRFRENPQQGIAIGDYFMPQFGATPAQPDLADRLGAGLRSWAYTSPGNPFAALANAITGLSTGQFAGAPTIRPLAGPVPPMDDAKSPVVPAVPPSMPRWITAPALSRRNLMPRQ